MRPAVSSGGRRLEAVPAAVRVQVAVDQAAVVAPAAAGRRVRAREAMTRSSSASGSS
jgi:hypothetical protein